MSLDGLGKGKWGSERHGKKGTYKKTPWKTKPSKVKEKRRREKSVYGVPKGENSRDGGGRKAVEGNRGGILYFPLLSGKKAKRNPQKVRRFSEVTSGGGYPSVPTSAEV